MKNIFFDRNFDVGFDLSVEVDAFRELEGRGDPPGGNDVMAQREAWLRVYLYAFGVGNIVIHPVLPFLFQEQFFWTPRNRPYEFMIGGIYIAMGIIMLLAARKPQQHKLFVDFTILGNLLHAVVMIAFGIWEQPAHLYGDVLWISAMWIIPLFFYPWGVRRIFQAA